MSRSTAIETSSLLVAAGAIMAMAPDARAGGLSVELVGWVLMGIGAWSLILFALVGTTSTTAIDTTFLDRERPVVRPSSNRRTTRDDLRV